MVIWRGDLGVHIEILYLLFEVLECFIVKILQLWVEAMIDKAICVDFFGGHMIRGGAVFMGLTRMVFDLWL